MRILGVVLATIVLFVALPVSAQNVGDRVQLVERAIGIPASSTGGAKPSQVKGTA